MMFAFAVLLLTKMRVIIDVKLDNIFVNYKRHDDVDNGIRFSDVQLGDLGGTYPADSKWAREGTPVGATLWNSPEVIMETPWNTATDIWSFGAVVCSLNIYPELIIHAQVPTNLRSYSS